MKVRHGLLLVEAKEKFGIIFEGICIARIQYQNLEIRIKIYRKFEFWDITNGIQVLT